MCGCIYTDGIFGFDIIKTENDIEKLFGSKYVKSNPNGIYKKIKKHLIDGYDVLFIGLPCQVSALKLYLGNSLLDRLYSIDLICHGTPSPKILNIFLNEKNINISDVTHISFRYRTNFQLQINHKGLSPKGIQDEYLMSFLKGICYTENCYECKYAQIMRVSDMTIGDSWGSLLSREEQEHGISLILCQTEKGKKLMDEGNLYLEDVDLDIAVASNHQLSGPTEKPRFYNLFFRILKRGGTVSSAVMRCYPKEVLKNRFIKLVFYVSHFDFLV